MEIRKLHNGEKYPMNLLLEADPSEEIVKEYLTRGECYTAWDERQIAGVYVLLPTRPETAELVNVAVAKEKRGKGIGKELVMHAVMSAKEKGFKTIEVGTGNSSIDQLAFYQKCGFRMNGIDKDFFIKHYHEEIYENGIRCRDMVRLSQDL
ncbi:GNAT family N-acetyltransferase [Peribacillus sp. B-H-3]|uniref:GNAT family N-acetyltransferase n=1 Tax=Peribacillus sp. B-H-3 TaxID=3400420 RepID=UPI003B02590C